MEFWASSEIDHPVESTTERARKLVGPYLSQAFAKGQLADFDAEIRYVPIVMNPDFGDVFSPKSRLYKKTRIYDCGPQLDYDTFVNGTLESQLAEYVRGIVTSSSHLKRLGATPTHIAEFEHIMSNTVKSIMSKS